MFTSLAEALGKAGRLSEGLEKLNEAARQIEATQEGWTEADMHRVRGELLIGIGDGRRNKVFTKPSPLRGGKAFTFGSCAPPPVSPASGATKASATKPATSSVQYLRFGHIRLVNRTAAALSSLSPRPDRSQQAHRGQCLGHRLAIDEDRVLS
jgi:hypothetical protein